MPGPTDKGLLFAPKPEIKGPVKYTPEGQGLPLPWPLKISEALRGLAGFGGDTSESQYGQVAGAMLPFVPGITRSMRMTSEALPEMMGLAKTLKPATAAVEAAPSPAVKALVGMLEEPPSSIDPVATALGERVTGRKYPESEFVVPKLVRQRKSPYIPGQIPSRAAGSKGLKFEMPAEMGPPKPRTAREASLYQEGHVPGFGQTAANVEEASKWKSFYKQYEKPKEPQRSFAKTAAAKQVEMVPAVKGLAEVGDITSVPKPASGATEQKPLLRDTSVRVASRGGPTRLTDFQIRAIRQMGGKAQDIAEQYGVGEQTIRAIRNRESFHWVKD